MAQTDGGQALNITQTQIVKTGPGVIYGLTVNSHTSGTFKIYDGLDDTAGAYATSTLTTSGLGYAKFAESVLTSDATNVADGATVTIGSIVYRFKDTMALAYDVKIGADAATSLDNLKAAINASGTAGVEYFAGTVAHALVIATTNTDTTQKVVSRTYGTGNNTLATTETSTHLAWEATTLGAGTGASVAGVATSAGTFVINGTTYYFTNQLSETLLGASAAVANEILWVTSDAVALDNMKLAINASGTEGTDYSTGTNANTDVIATTNGNTTQVIQARQFGTAGNAITTTETIATTSWTSTVMTGGTDGSKLLHNTYTLPSGPQVVAFPRADIFANGLYIVVGGTADLTVHFS